ncbi:MAG: hypothetical protein OXN89_03465 [Bryobacterales bacterium]|nr:hypothetical protein [Bryobacterales bacterium]
MTYTRTTSQKSLRLATLFFLLSVSSGIGQEESSWVASEEDLQRFQLFNYCSGADSKAVLDDEKAVDLDLSEESLQNALESRMRAARLHRDRPDGDGLVLDVHVVGRGFKITLALYKSVRDLASGKVYFAATWQAGFTGQHSGRSGYILESTSMLIDEFIAKYLRINEPYCR